MMMRLCETVTGDAMSASLIDLSKKHRNYKHTLHSPAELLEIRGRGGSLLYIRIAYYHDWPDSLLSIHGIMNRWLSPGSAMQSTSV